MSFKPHFWFWKGRALTEIKRNASSENHRKSRIGIGTEETYRSSFRKTKNVASAIIRKMKERTKSPL